MPNSLILFLGGILMSLISYFVNPAVSSSPVDTAINSAFNVDDTSCSTDVICLGNYNVDLSAIGPDTAVTVRFSDLCANPEDFSSCPDTFYVKIVTSYGGVIAPDSVTLSCAYFGATYQYIISNLKEGSETGSCWGYIFLNNAPTVDCSERFQDSVSLVNMYRATGGPNWTNSWDLQQPMDSWYGVTLDANGQVTCLDLDGVADCQFSSAANGNNLTGGVFTLDLPQLTFLSLANNHLIWDHVFSSPLPNLQALHFANNSLEKVRHRLQDLPSLQTFSIENNKLTFEDLLPNAPAWSSLTAGNGGEYTYAPQQDFATESPVYGPLGYPFALDLQVDDTVSTSTYLWYKDDMIFQSIVGGNQLYLAPLSASSAGVYHCLVTNSILPDLTLRSKDIQLIVDNSLPCRAADSLALVDLYNAANGPNWIISWDLNQPMTTWFGVQLNGEGCVSCLDLDGNANCALDEELGGNNLSGQLPDLDLPNLTFLSLEENNLSGSIPNFSNLPSLQQIYLGRNAFGGTIPDFSNFPALATLSLRKNQLVGPIPDFTGLASLTRLYLDQNQLNGSLPDFSNLPLLVNLWLGSNELSGIIPDFSHLPKIRTLLFGSNGFTGGLPDFQNIPTLQTLEVNFTPLGGTLPDFSNLPLLRNLRLREAQLSGSIPDFSNLPNLEDLNLEGNSLTGNLPDFTALGNLERLTLSNCLLNGPIPTLSNCAKLESINLENNQFTGCVPLFGSPALQFIILSNNELDCVIPDLSYLPNLKTLYLRENQFTFEEILPNYDPLQSHIDNNGGLIVYNPQQAISDDALLESYVGASLTIDLVVDDTVTTNEYYWYKDGSFFTQITGVNELTFADLQLTDAGVYFCEVYNPNAPNAGLFSGYFTLSVSDTPPLPLCDDDMLTLNQTPIPADTYQAFSTLESAGTVTAMTEVVFIAGESIRLLPGFQAQAGSQFQAYIEDCELPEENLIQLPRETAKPKENSALSLAVFPNPGRSITNVEYVLPEQADIQLYLVDMNGRIMQTLKNHTPAEAGIYQQEVDLSNLPAGIYMVQLLTDRQRTQSRLVKID